MASVIFKKGMLANLPAARETGTFYVAVDEHALYLDVDSSNRIRIGDFQEFDTLTALQANTNPSTTALYYIADVNCLAKWNGTNYVQINLDTGATSVETVGDGNVFTDISYDPATRKLTLTRGATFATADDVDNKIAAKVGDIDALTDRMTATETAITTLNGDETTAGSVKKQVADAVAKIVADAPEAYDTLKEISVWITDHANGVADMNTRINTNKSDIAALQALVGTLPNSAASVTIVDYISEVVANIPLDDYAKVTDLNAAVTRVAVAESKLDTLTGADTVDGSVAKALKDAKAYADDLMGWGSF